MIRVLRIIRDREDEGLAIIGVVALIVLALGFIAMLACENSDWCLTEMIRCCLT